MPFPMAHLNIATKILNSVPDTVNPRDFYIGSLAPDSVHFVSYPERKPKR
jgi:hypothetical protein